MFTIHKQRTGEGGIRGSRVPAVRWCGAACALGVLFWITGLFAQCGFTENGYVFLHPFFNNANWQAAIYQADLFFDEDDILCTAKPVQAAASSLAAQGTFVYTTSGGKWMATNGPLVNAACKPLIEFAVPFDVAVPAALGLKTMLPFHLMSRGNIDKDTVYLVAVSASASGRVYCLHMHTGSGMVGAVDTLIVNPSAQQAINGVWGEPNGAGIDTALWAGGSGGLLKLFPFKNNLWGRGRDIAIDNRESVTAIGGGFAGTVSGKIYRRSGASYISDNNLAGTALRQINGRIAVGDAGTVLIYRNGSWQSFSKGNTNYRYGNLTGTAGGTAVELLDDGWNYTSRTLYDSTTGISSVSPSKVSAGLNSGLYKFDDNGVSTVIVRLRDIDDNRAIPVVTVKGKSTTVVLNKASDGTILLRHDPSAIPSAICSTAQAFFIDTLVNIILDPQKVTLDAKAQRGNYNPSCGICKWQSYQFKSTASWNRNDTLVASAGSDTLKIVNDSNPAVTILQSVSGRRGVNNGPAIYHLGRSIYLRIGSVPQISHCTLIDATGRLVWRRNVAALSNSTIVSPLLPAGVHFLRIDYTDGRSEIRRIALIGR